MRIGVVNPFATYIFPNLIPELYRHFPDINIRVIRNVSSAEVVDQMKESQLDIGFISESFEFDHSIRCVTLYEERFVFIANTSHPLAKNPQITASDLQYDKFVSLDSKSSITQIVQEYMRANRMTPHSTIEINSVAAIKELVKKEQLITLLPELFIDKEMQKGEFVELPVRPVPPVLTTSLIYTPYCQRPDVVEFIQKAVQEIALTHTGLRLSEGNRISESSL